MMTLAEYIAGWPRKFDWSRSHCGHFAMGWVNASTGRDALAAIPDAATARQWVGLVERSGGMAHLVSDRLRCKPIAPAVSQPGDIVLFPGRITGGALGIRLHAGAAVLGDDGAVRVVSISDAVAAWPVSEVLP